MAKPKAIRDTHQRRSRVNTFVVTYGKLKDFEDDIHKHVHLENNGATRISWWKRIAPRSVAG